MIATTIQHFYHSLSTRSVPAMMLSACIHFLLYSQPSPVYLKTSLMIRKTTCREIETLKVTHLDKKVTRVQS